MRAGPVRTNVEAPAEMRPHAHFSVIAATKYRQRLKRENQAFFGTQCDSMRRNADADRAAHPGAAKAAIAMRVLGQVLLVVILGEVERRRIADFGGDRPMPSAASALA